MFNTSGENVDIQSIQILDSEAAKQVVGFSLTSVTVVLWKVSVLYSQPPWQLSVGCPSPGTTAPLWFKGTVQDSSGRPSGPDSWLKLKFEGAGAAAEGHEERHKCGGTAPVKTETSMWNARKI